MPDDILDAAQQAINNASKTSGSSLPAVPPPAPAVEDKKETTVVPLPVPVVSAPAVPTPTVSTTEKTTVVTSTVPPAPEPLAQAPSWSQPSATPTPSSANVSIPVAPTAPVEPMDTTKQELVNTLLGNTAVAPQPSISQSSTPPIPPSIPPKKKSAKGMLLALIATLLLTLPIGVYYISRSDNNLTDQRNSAAWDTVYQGCTVNPNSCPAGQTCHCQNGNACTYTMCEADIEGQCRLQGREYCINGYNGNAYTCCLPGYSCGPGGVGCYNGPNPTNPPGENPTSTPTGTIAPICQNIKIYKGGVQVSPSTLRPGDAVVLAVKGNLAPTKGRFRVNGGAFTETTTKNANNEFTLNFTVPTGVTSFVIEAEVFTNGAWF